ncbi:DUF819 domain-containing protein [Aquimarina hainanensis]|uniref:DUF819 domain-containing protein n=1 Tax=Aquimarina hainanensis TaxID=1578017 RepID=A0ABW5N6C3_9FLAO|nr:DUF819 family protein [Aquimarina sp. TRL1]QKX05663.1 DUF819 family protein [Aquimarina sp. TRL1]
METVPLFTNDTIVFGILMLCLGIVFYTSSLQNKFWKSFYTYVPSLLLCYLLPAIFHSLGIIAPEWKAFNAEGVLTPQQSNVYYIASRYLLPASLVLMTLSIDLKGIFSLGPKALIMFITGTIGIIIGGPIAVLFISWISPEIVGGIGPDAVWRGLSTIAGSWIGGGANQAAMLEIYQFNPDRYGAMVLVDIVVANVWMALLLIGIGKNKAINNWLKADTSAIESLKQRVATYTENISRKASLTDLMIILSIAFTAVGVSHWGANNISQFLSDNFEVFNDKSSSLSSFTSTFFWMVTLATLIGILLSFTKAKNYEGAGASKIGSVCIHILVATIGMKMDLGSIFKDPGLIAVGFIWMTIHAILLIGVAKLIKAPYFFLAVGSQANVGAAASAPVVAAAFHPSLAVVGVLLAVFGYAIGTYGALLCTILMQIASGG